MAILPLFNATVESVKARLRLQGVAATDPGQPLIEGAVQAVRVGFYRQIEQAQINVLLSYSSVENPTNEQEVLRQLAEVTELKWIRYELMRSMPMLFMDSAAGTQQAWNDEGIFRGMGVAERDAELKRLWSEIVQSLSLLTADETIPDETTMRVDVFVPDSAPMRPFGSLMFGSPWYTGITSPW